MKRFGLLFVCGLGLLSQPGWAAPQAISPHVRTAGDLAELCGAQPGAAGADAKINYCHGFAQGAVDARLSMPGDKKPFCFPSPAPTRAATMMEFTGWARSMPANREMPVLSGLFKFLGDRFPCKS